MMEANNTRWQRSRWKLSLIATAVAVGVVFLAVGCKRKSESAAATTKAKSYLVVMTNGEMVLLDHDPNAELRAASRRGYEVWRTADLVLELVVTGPEPKFEISRTNGVSYQSQQMYTLSELEPIVAAIPKSNHLALIELPGMWPSAVENPLVTASNVVPQIQKMGFSSVRMAFSRWAMTFLVDEPVTNKPAAPVESAGTNGHQ